MERVGPIVSKSTNGYTICLIINTDDEGKLLPDTYAIFDSTGKQVGLYGDLGEAESVMQTWTEEDSRDGNDYSNDLMRL